MKIIISFIFLLLSSIFGYGQNEFRPIIDSTTACSYYDGYTVERHFNPNSPKKYDEAVNSQMQIFYIAEKMPVPVMELDEIGKLLDKEVHLIKSEKTLKAEMYFQCIVNCKGKAGDFQIIKCPERFSNVCCQVYNIIQEKLSSWQPGKQKDQNIDMLIKVQVNIENGKFNVDAPI